MPTSRTRACLAALAATLLFAGCGGSSGDGGIPSEVSASLQDQIDTMKSQFDEGDCKSANSTLTAIRSTANEEGVGIKEKTLDDINELIDNLDQQLDSDCVEAQETTTTTTEEETTSTVPETTEETTSTAEETTSTEEEPPDTSTDEEEEPPPPPPGGGEDGGGDSGGTGTGSGSGGIGGG